MWAELTDDIRRRKETVSLLGKFPGPLNRQSVAQLEFPRKSHSFTSSPCSSFAHSRQGQGAETIPNLNRVSVHSFVTVSFLTLWLQYYRFREKLNITCILCIDRTDCSLFIYTRCTAFNVSTACSVPMQELTFSYSLCNQTSTANLPRASRATRER